MFVFTINKNGSRAYHLFKTLWIVIFGLLIWSTSLWIEHHIHYFHHKTNLESEIKKTGILIVATRNGPTSLYQGAFGPEGFEYDLVNAFAKYLNVKIKWLVLPTLQDVIQAIHTGKADIGAAGMIVTPKRKKIVRFGPVYRHVKIELVYRQSSQPPSSIADLGNKPIVVPAHSIYSHLLRKLVQQYPKLIWKPVSLDENQILLKIARCRFQYTLDNSDNLNISRHYFPQLASTFTIGQPQSVAWALPPHGNGKFLKIVNTFFLRIRESGFLKQVSDSYFNSVKPLSYASAVTFLHNVKHHLSQYKKLMKKVGKMTNLNWKLLAAQSYEESHWDPYARSYTDVRGLMMLTSSTAIAMGVNNVFDPEQELLAGARYLQKIEKQLPKSIKKRNRIWIALAAYNLGLQHIYDAQKLAKELGKNPNTWNGLRQVLPLLSDRRWFRHLPHGYAPGWAAVEYVRNIKNYFDILSALQKQPIQGFATGECG